MHVCVLGAYRGCTCVHMAEANLGCHSAVDVAFVRQGLSLRLVT